MKMYFIYHIPGKKIGVTNDLQNRVEKQQGYEEDEYEVLEMSEDINYISVSQNYKKSTDTKQIDNLIKICTNQLTTRI